MKIIVAIVITFVVTLVVTLRVSWSLLARKPTKKKRRKTPKKEKTTMKRVVWLCLGNGIAWVWCSYGLAMMGRGQIAEALSQVAITEIIGVVLVYAAKAGIENLSKNNTWPDKTNNSPAPTEEQGSG